jgi:hypothetical protein
MIAEALLCSESHVSALQPISSDTRFNLPVLS